MVWVSLAPKSPDLISIGPLEGAVVVYGGGLGELDSEAVDVVVVGEVGHAGQVEGVGVGQSHAFVVVLSVLWLDVSLSGVTVVTVVHGSGGGVVHGGGVGQLVSDGVVAVVIEVGHGGQSVGVVVGEVVVVVVEVVVVVALVVGVGGKLRLTRDLPKTPPCFTWMRKLISSLWSSCRHSMPPRSWSSALFSSFAALLIPRQLPNCVSLDLMLNSGSADEGNARFTVNG